MSNQNRRVTELNVSRRSLVKGLAWSVPVVTFASTSPAFAASPSCSTQIDEKFVAAQEYLRNNYYCNGEPVLLQLNVYQPVAASDGYGQQIWVNVKNLSECDVAFSKEYPLRVNIKILNTVRVTSGSKRRSVSGVATSWGSEETTWTSYDIYDAPIGTMQDDIYWNFSGTLPGKDNGDNEADLRIDFGDGLAGTQRWKNHLAITPLMGSGAPTFEATSATDTEECRAYYQQKLLEWKSPFNFTFLGNYNPYNMSDGYPITAGTTVNTRSSGNLPSDAVLESRKNGIF